MNSSMSLSLWLVVLFGATFRLTRLLTRDSITNGLRDWLHSHGTRTLIGHNYVGAPTETKIETRAGLGRVWHFIFDLLSCDWCTSLWVSAVVVALAHWQGSWFKYVCDALSLSAATGLISDRT